MNDRTFAAVAYAGLEALTFAVALVLALLIAAAVAGAEPPRVKGFRHPPRIKGFEPAPCCPTCPAGVCPCPGGACPTGCPTDGYTGKPAPAGYQWQKVGGEPWKLVPVAPGVAAPVTFRDPAHTCGRCGVEQRVVSGFNPDGTHTHVCNSCGNAWRH